MAKYSLDKIATRTRTGFFAAIFLLFVSYFLSFISTKKVRIQDYYINHTNEVIHNLDNILGLVSTGESAFRGYLIANDKYYLPSYDNSLINIDTAFSNLALLTMDNQVQRKNMDTLRHYVNQKYIMMGKAIFDFSSKQKFSTSLIQGKEEDIANAKKLELQIAKMKQNEIDVRNEWSQKLSRYSDLILVLNFLSITIAILLAIYSLVVYNKENRQKS